MNCPALPDARCVRPRRAGRLSGLLVALGSVLVSATVLAQGLPDADRNAPLSIDAGQMKIDTKRRVRLLSGGVELTRGGFWLKSAQVELREAAQGDVAVATGVAGEPAVFRQKREALDELIEGRAERIEYDTRAEIVRLIDKAVLKRWRGGVLAEEVTGQVVVYDHLRETFEVQGGGPGSRVKGLVTPSAASAAKPGEAR